MTTEPATMPLTPEELLLRRKAVRKWILLRGVLLGALIAAWWIFFAPDSLMEKDLKITLGIVVGFLATGSYLFNLRDAILLRSTMPPTKPGGAD